MIRLFNTFASLCSFGSGHFPANGCGAAAYYASILRWPASRSARVTIPKNPVRLFASSAESRMPDIRGDTPPRISSGSDATLNWLVIGDGDLSYSAMIAEDLASNHAKTRLIATVLEDKGVHNQVYERSKQNEAKIESHSQQVKFGVDGTNLPLHFPEEDARFDVIEFNFPHWRGKTNAKKNRDLVDRFLKSASSVLKPTGEIRIALCHGQGGMPAESLQEWRQSWLPAVYAAEHGLLLTRLEPYEPKYGLSSHRGVDRPFFIGDNPQRYCFQFPNGDAVPDNLQISCRHELQVMLHSDKLEKSCMTFEDIVHGDALLDLGREFIPEGIRFEIAAQTLLTSYKSLGDHVPLAVFLLNHSGESQPLTRSAADQIRDKIEKAVASRWGLDIAKGGRLVSRPYPYVILPSLIKEHN